MQRIPSRKNVLEMLLPGRWTRAAAALACVAAALGGLPAQAQATGMGGSKTQVGVRTVVAASFRLSPMTQPSRLEVTAQDIVRGYVDLPQASSFQLASNTRNDFQVAVGYDTSFISEIAIRVLDAEFVAAVPGASGSVRNPHVGKQQVLVSYRIRLNDKARPGTYPWPIGLSFSTLA